MPLIIKYILKLFLTNLIIIPLIIKTILKINVNKFNSRNVILQTTSYPIIYDVCNF